VGTISQPITYGELQRYDLNSLISGFNLTFSVEDTADLPKRIKDKLSFVKVVSESRDGQISHQIYQDGSKSSMVFLSRNNDQSLLGFGTTDDRTLLPAITNTTLLENNPSLVCYDAVWLQLDNIAIVDCAQKTSDGQTNYFFVVNTLSHSVIAKIKNEFTLPPVNAVNRKLRTFSDVSKRLSVRAYLSASKGSTETVAEIWSFTKP
jgi:hypothetical protein